MFYNEAGNLEEESSRRPWTEGEGSGLESSNLGNSDQENNSVHGHVGPSLIKNDNSPPSFNPSPVRFSYILGILQDSAEPPDSSLFNDLLNSLRRALVFEMRRRALWQAPPRYLGIVGGDSWDEHGLEELLLDCYEFVFVRRLSGLLKQRKTKPNIDGLVFRAISSFLHEAQKRHDPVGFRVFQIARAAIELLLKQGRLHQPKGDAELQCSTVLTFTPWGAPDLFEEVELSPQVEIWNASLLPDLVAAHHREPVTERLAEAVASLAGEGIAGFHFRDLVEPLKADVRARWHALAPHMDTDDRSTLDAMMLPGADYEARQQFESLLRCTSQGLDQLEVRKKTKEYLRRLWLFLRNWALEMDGLETPTDRPLSDARLGELLGIPRARLPKLKTTLGEVVESCRRNIVSPENSHLARPGSRPQTSRNYSNGESTLSTALDMRHRLLRKQTTEVAHAWKHSMLLRTNASPPRLGDRYIFNNPEALPVEWLVLQNSNTQGNALHSTKAPKKDQLFTVPVDDNPLKGSYDHALDDHDCAHLRGACGVWVSPQTIAKNGVLTGRLEKEQLLSTQRNQQEKPSISSEQQEVDADPEYRAWLHTLKTEGARLGEDTTEEAQIIRPEAFQRRRPLLRNLAIAASLLAAASLPFLLRPTSPKTPLLVPFSEAHSVSIGDVTRGVDDSILEVVAGQELVVTISLWRIERQPRYRMEILQEDSTKWRSEIMAAQEEFLLVLPEDFLPAGYYQLRIYGVDENGVERLLKESSSGIGSW